VSVQIYIEVSEHRALLALYLREITEQVACVFLRRLQKKSGANCVIRITATTEGFTCFADLFLRRFIFVIDKR
jgi:hypothetical protein